jgi:archaellum component FlaD/FlaE
MANVDDGFGLFDRPDEAEDAALDDDVAEADAASFFDDDFDDFDGEEADEAPEAEEDAELEEPAGGMSFDDLKAEFDAGAWDEEAEEASADDEPTLDEADRVDAAADDAEDEADETPIDETAAVGADTAFTDVVDAPEDAADADVYLAAVPQTYAGQYLLTELAESLVAVGGVAGAVEAARYYETLGWVSEPVRRALCDHVLAADEAAGEDARRLTSTDHLRSLGYLSRLAGDHADGEALGLAVATAGSRDGIRG